MVCRPPITMIGHVIKCVVCRDEVEEEECRRDPQMGGFVCKECQDRLIIAHKHLWNKSITRPVAPEDINHWNCKRFQSGYTKPL